MQKLTKLTGAVALSALMTTTAIAQTPNVAETPVNSTQTTNITANNADLDFAFKSATDLEVKNMNEQEMQETQGAFLPWLIGGLLLLVPVVANAPSSSDN